MDTILKTLIQVYPNREYNGFKHYIAISSDSLLIIDKQLEMVEWIIEGDDTSGVYLSADDEDDFLDAIIVLKKIILSGHNPLLVL